MDNRYEIAEQNGMSREFADWFFDNKKAGCGNVWFMMMAAMWEGWQGRAAMLHGSDGNSPVIPDGWVACSERMPETDFKVLANVKSTAVEYQCLAEVDENGRWWDEYGEQLPSPFVTHWQPLPAAPQQEAKNV